jgi:hypothetical protein
MNLDYTTSTVEIAGRRFPAANAVCPPTGPDDTDSERDRMLAGHGGPGTIGLSTSYEVLIPCENGVLVSVELDSKYGYKVSLHSRTCRSEPWDDTHIMIPCFVSIVGGNLVAEQHRNPRGGLTVPSGPWRWDGAEPEWIVELIDRVGRMPFIQPPGPEVRLISLAEGDRLDERVS